MIAVTAVSGPDGRPLIEVATFSFREGSLAFTGSAVAYEATLLVTFLDGKNDILRVDFVTVSRGGPERGEWTYAGITPDGAVAVRIGQEEMDEGRSVLADRQVELPLSAPPDADQFSVGEN